MRDPKDIARPIVDRESGKLQGFRLSREGARKNAINRRAFLRGAGTGRCLLSPFLEGLPERLAWAATSPPVFTMFIVGSCGVVGESFLPDATGALTTSGLAGISATKAASAVGTRAEPTMLKQINWPQNVKLRSRGGSLSGDHRDRSRRDRAWRLCRRTVGGRRDWQGREPMGVDPIYLLLGGEGRVHR